MVVIMNKDFDGYKSGKQYSIEISLARRYVEGKIAIPLSVHLDKLAEQKRAKEKAEEAKKKELLKKKEEATKETADSKPAVKRTKAVKK
jgi:hypothetical protein